MSNRIMISSNKTSTNSDDRGIDMYNESASIQFTRETLSNLTEVSLREVERRMDRQINSRRRRREASYDIEIEMCYVQDEINRREATEKAALAYERRQAALPDQRNQKEAT